MASVGKMKRIDYSSKDDVVVWLKGRKRRKGNEKEKKILSKKCRKPHM